MLATALRDQMDPFAPARPALDAHPPAGDLAAPAWTPPGGAVDAGAMHEVFGGYTDGQLHSSNGVGGGQATKQPHGPKSATKAEAQAIQALIDQANKVEAAAKALDAEAKKLAARKDPGARAKANEAAAKWREVQGFKQQAINKAVAAYNIDITHVSSLLYDRSNPDGEAETDERAVTIGDAAFTDPGNLGSTIAHEAEVHVNQQTMRGRNYDGQQGRALNEIQAYDYEIANAKRFGLTKDEVDGLRRTRQHYMDYLNATYRARRAKGDYSLPKGHEDD